MAKNNLIGELFGGTTLECDHCGATMMIKSSDRNIRGIGDRCVSCGKPPKKMFYACFLCGDTDVWVREWIDPNRSEVCPVPEETMLKTTTEVLVPVYDGIRMDVVEFLNHKGMCRNYQCVGGCEPWPEVPIVCLPREQQENLLSYRTQQRQCEYDEYDGSFDD